MDGHEPLKEIKKIYLKPVVYIAHTVYGNEEGRENTKSSGFDYHVTKPLESKNFIELLASIEEFH